MCKSVMVWRCSVALAGATLIIFQAPSTVAQSPKQQSATGYDVRSGQPLPDIHVESGEMPSNAQSVTIYSAQSPQGGVTNVSAEAVVYKNPNREPIAYSVFQNYNSSSGSMFPGVMLADDMGLGAGYRGGVDEISSYSTLFYRSPLDIQPGLADFHVELWDGDPFCMFDTPANGYACAPIPGTEADFIDVPAGTQFTATHVLPKGVVAPHTRVWMVVTGSETGINPSPCRLGWQIAYGPGVIGGAQQYDPDVFGPGYGIFLLQDDENNGADAVDSLGTCCSDGADCDASMSCTGDTTTGARHFCYDNFAETAGAYYFSPTGSYCQLYAGTNCSNFVASIFAPASSVISLLPVSASTGTIQGNEVVIPGGPADLELDIRVSSWDPNGQGTMLKAWEADIDASGYYGGFQGYLTPTIRNCAGICVSPAINAGNPCTHDSDCAIPPNLDGDCYFDIPEADDSCRSAFGGICTEGGGSCISDADCGSTPFDTCGGPACMGDFGADSANCTSGFIFSGRGDYVYKTIADLHAVDTGTLDYRYASTVQTGLGVAPPDPFPSEGLYMGTLRLTASADCKGTFTVGFRLPPSSVLVDESNQFIPRIGFSQAKITCEIGRCCYDLYGAGGCWESVTQSECDDAPGPSFWCEGLTCDTDCIECLSDDVCQDGLWCNGHEVCQLGCESGCFHGTPPDCDDGIACTVDSCVEGGYTGHCDHVPDNALCDDGVWCNGIETCDPSTGCVTGPVPCNDNVACTTDTCDESTQSCASTPNDSACDDGLFCNGVETCDALDDCQPGTAPCASGTCDEAGDMCIIADIPTASIWGLLVLTLLFAIMARIVFRQSDAGRLRT